MRERERNNQRQPSQDTSKRLPPLTQRATEVINPFHSISGLGDYRSVFGVFVGDAGASRDAEEGESTDNKGEGGREKGERKERHGEKMLKI